jgi:hypothetical protein
MVMFQIRVLELLDEGEEVTDGGGEGGGDGTVGGRRRESRSEWSWLNWTLY